MNKLKRWKLALLLAVLAAALSACMGGGEEQPAEPEQPPAAEEQPPAGEEPAEETPAAEDPAVSGPADEAQAAEDLPETAELEVSIEGMAEKVPATLALSEQGYAVYVMDGFVFTGEEPGIDQLYFAETPLYFTQIRKLPADSNLEDLRANAEAQLGIEGGAQELQGEEIPEALRDETKFYVHASNAEVSRSNILLEKGGALYLVTMNLPNGEASEGVTPRFMSMIDSVVTTK